MLPVMLRMVRRGHGPLGGLAAVVRAFGAMSAGPEVGRAHCEVATQVAERFGFDEAFRSALFQAFERWDGSGTPLKVKGEAIALGTRIALVAVESSSTSPPGRRWVGMFMTAFPNGRHVFDLTEGAGDYVLSHGHFTGTHTGEFQGMPATGKAIKISLTMIDKTVDGKLVEHYGDFDSAGVMQQLMQ